MHGWTRTVDETLAVALEFLRQSWTDSAAGHPPTNLTAASRVSLSTSLDPDPSTPPL
jgi:hypothetical protein